MSCSFSICACKTEGISFPLSFPISPTQFQGRILKPIYSGLVESSKFTLLKSFFFPIKEGGKGGCSGVFSAAQQVSDILTIDTAQNLNYC